MKKITLHAGHGFTQHATNLLHELSNNRLHIENMTKVELGKGQYEFLYLMGCIEGSDSALVTLETSWISKALDGDMNNLYILNKFLKI